MLYACFGRVAHAKGILIETKNTGVVAFTSERSRIGFRHRRADPSSTPIADQASSLGWRIKLPSGCRARFAGQSRGRLTSHRSYSLLLSTKLFLPTFSLCPPEVGKKPQSETWPLTAEAVGV